MKAAVRSQSKSKVDKELLATDDDIHQSAYRIVLPKPSTPASHRPRSHRHQQVDVVTSPDVSSRVVAVVVDEAHCVSKWYVDNIKLCYTVYLCVQ